MGGINAALTDKTAAENIVRWINRNYDPAPKPGETLDWNKDIIPMIEATEYERDAAAIALQFDAGLRGFEFSDLAVGGVR